MIKVEAKSLEVSQRVVHPPGRKEGMDLQTILNLMSSGLRDSLHVGAQGEGEITGADPQVFSLVPRGRIAWRGKGCHEAAEGKCWAQRGGQQGGHGGLQLGEEDYTAGTDGKTQRGRWDNEPWA